jgi:hypothetical protein
MLTPDERARTLTYLHALRREEGGYADQPGNARSGLQDTVNVWRALRLLDGSVQDARAMLAFVHRCFDPRSGGFCERPGAGPTVLSTALALILLRGLDEGGRSLAEWRQPAARFLDGHARSAMDHFLVVAAHEEGALPGVTPGASLEFFGSRRLPDGTFGDSAFANAIACGALLRGRGRLPHPAPIVARLLRAQTAEGGFADHSGPADLLTTYAATHALVLLDRAPDLAGLRRYLMVLRRHDGGFAMRAGAGSSAGATYQALAVRAWTLRASASSGGGGARAAGASRAGRGSRTA